MKKRLQELGYNVISKKTYNGDTLYILLSKSTDSYLGSFKLSDDGILYNTDFNNLGIYELQKICEVIEK